MATPYTVPAGSPGEESQGSQGPVQMMQDLSLGQNTVGPPSVTPWTQEEIQGTPPVRPRTPQEIAAARVEMARQATEQQRQQQIQQVAAVQNQGPQAAAAAAAQPNIVPQNPAALSETLTRAAIALGKPLEARPAPWQQGPQENDPIQGPSQEEAPSVAQSEAAASSGTNPWDGL